MVAFTIHRRAAEREVAEERQWVPVEQLPPARPIRRDARQTPQGFRERWQTDSLRSIAADFGMSRETAKAIARREGLPAKKPCPGRPREYRKDAIPRPFVVSGPKLSLPRAIRDVSPAGQAADFLRRFGPVVRCDATGAYRPDGEHWRRGSTVLSADDIIARAMRQGWSYAL